MNFWKDQRVLVTGAAGFLGRVLCRQLKDKGCGRLFTFRSKEYDLRKAAHIKKLLKSTRPDLIFHLAASVGRI